MGINHRRENGLTRWVGGGGEELCVHISKNLQ